jgi:hypothetical protein
MESALPSFIINTQEYARSLLKGGCLMYLNDIQMYNTVARSLSQKRAFSESGSWDFSVEIEQSASLHTAECI